MNLSVILGTNAAAVAAEMPVFAQTSGIDIEPAAYPEILKGIVAPRASAAPAVIPLTVTHRFAAEPSAFLGWARRVDSVQTEEPDALMVDAPAIERANRVVEDERIEAFLNTNANSYPLLRAIYTVAREHGIVHITYGTRAYGNESRTLTLMDLRAAFLNPATTDGLVKNVGRDACYWQFSLMCDPKPPFTLDEAAAQKPEAKDLLHRLQSGETVMVKLHVGERWELCEIAPNWVYAGGVEMPVRGGDDEELLVRMVRPGPLPFRQSALGLLKDLVRVYADTSTAEAEFINERCTAPNVRRAVFLAQTNGFVFVANREKPGLPQRLTWDELRLMILRGEFYDTVYYAVAATGAEWCRRGNPPLVPILDILARGQPAYVVDAFDIIWKVDPNSPFDQGRLSFRRVDPGILGDARVSGSSSTFEQFFTEMTGRGEERYRLGKTLEFYDNVADAYAANYAKALAQNSGLADILARAGDAEAISVTAERAKPRARVLTVRGGSLGMGTYVTARVNVAALRAAMQHGEVALAGTFAGRGAGVTDTLLISTFTWAGSTSSSVARTPGAPGVVISET